MRLFGQAALFVFVLGILSVASTEYRPLADGTVAQVEAIPGVPKWHLFPHLWSYNAVDISCPDQQVEYCSSVPAAVWSCSGLLHPTLQDFDVFFAKDEELLLDKASDGDTAWCGMERLLSGHRHKCSISITPFETTYVGVVPTRGHHLFAAGVCSLLSLTKWVILVAKQSSVETRHQGTYALNNEHSKHIILNIT
jgi:hypothetical protein